MVNAIRFTCKSDKSVPLLFYFFNINLHFELLAVLEFIQLC